jgi:hypothetical protein
MDIEARFEALENKIICQENKLRLHKRLGLAAACALAVVIAIGAVKPIPKVIEAEKFVLRDAKGAEKDLWQVTSVGSEFMMAEGEKRKLFLVIDRKRTAMIIFDKQGLVRLQADSSYEKPGKGDEKPGFLLFDKDGRIQVAIFARNRSTPELGFMDSSGKLRAFMGLSEGRAPILSLQDAAEQPRSHLAVPKSGKPEVIFWDKNEK